MPDLNNIPVAPVIQFLIRTGGKTLFKWGKVSRNVSHSAITPAGYYIYRSRIGRNDGFSRIYGITTKDLSGDPDTLFTEDINGFYAYGVTAYNSDGESSMATMTVVDTNITSA
jgi:hypothetical protein